MTIKEDLEIIGTKTGYKCRKFFYLTNSLTSVRYFDTLLKAEEAKALLEKYL